jgi:hypothetical protein
MRYAIFGLATWAEVVTVVTPAVWLAAIEGQLEPQE